MIFVSRGDVRFHGIALLRAENLPNPLVINAGIRNAGAHPGSVYGNDGWRATQSGALLRSRSLPDTLNPMSKTIETIYRNGQIQLPADLHLPEDTRVTVILPEDPTHGVSADSAYDIPDLATDIGPPDLARNLGHYLYGHPKQS
jgi:hypothetical protein